MVNVLNNLVVVSTVFVCLAVSPICWARVDEAGGRSTPNPQVIGAEDLLRDPSRYLGERIRVRCLLQVWTVPNGTNIRSSAASRDGLWTTFAESFAKRTNRRLLDRYYRLLAAGTGSGFPPIVSNNLEVDITGYVTLRDPDPSRLCGFTLIPDPALQAPPLPPDLCLVIEQLHAVRLHPHS